MPVGSNPEESEWRHAWQTRSAPPRVPDLRARVEAETRRLKVAMIGPVITTLAAGGGTLATALTRRAPADIALAVGVWAFIVVVWVIALWAARGTWRPLAQSTDGFVRLSIRRCRSVLEGLYAGIALYVIGFIGILWWKIHYLSMSFAELMSSWQVLVIGFAVSPILLFALLAVARRKRAELRAWRGMLGDVDNDAR